MISWAKVKRILPTTIPIAISLILIVSFIILPIQASEPSQPQLEAAPMREPSQQQPPVIEGHGTGFMPPAMDLSHLTGQQMPEGFVAGEPLVGQPPDSFDWRITDKVTSVNDQGACGSCYAFASIANIESKMLIDGAAALPDPDYSENNAKECNYWETANIDGGTSCSGGNFLIMANWFSKKGTVLESCDPYVASDVACTSICTYPYAARDVACTSTCTYQKTLLDWRIICGDVVPDTNVLKNYIQTYGPVYTSMYAGDPGTVWGNEFASYVGSYTLYYSGTETPNHAVLVVGWDNSLSYDGGTGAWIVKNSWGTGWGDGGYFTIAYGSASIGMNSSFIYDWQDYDGNGQVMYYDECGLTTGWGQLGGGNTTCWGLCKFIPSSDTYVKRVEFWTTDVTTDIEVYIYDDFDGTNLSNLLASKLDNNFSEAGYHSVEVDTPLPVTTGDDVIAVVKFTNSSYGYPVAADNKGPNEIGRTYISLTGDSWTDLGGAYADDVAIRLRTSALVEELQAEAGGPYSGVVDEDIAISGSASGGASPYTYAWDLDNDGVYDDAVGQSITHSWSVADTYTIGLQVTDGASATATDTATVVVSESDWNPWDDDGVISDEEISLAEWHWATNTPINGHTITDAEISLLEYQWATGGV